MGHFPPTLNPWGTPNMRRRRDMSSPFSFNFLLIPHFDNLQLIDRGSSPSRTWTTGLLEVVGFKDAWHGLVLLAPNGHGTRLAQANRIRFEFRKGGAQDTYMRIDGEPWRQPLPVDDDTVVVEISHHGKLKMLATNECKAASVLDPSSLPSSPMGNDDDRRVCWGRVEEVWSNREL